MLLIDGSLGRVQLGAQLVQLGLRGVLGGGGRVGIVAESGRLIYSCLLYTSRCV